MISYLEALAAIALPAAGSSIVQQRTVNSGWVETIWRFAGAGSSSPPPACSEILGKQISLKERCRNRYTESDEIKERMMKPNTLGVALALVLAAGPAMAKRAISSPGYQTQSIYCATREMGNPFSKYCDYVAWSKWRSRGGWDSRLDDACWHNPHYKPPGCWP
jgi:hypothetical protein